MTKNSEFAIDLLFRCSRKLHLQSFTACLAAHMFHRFYTTIPVDKIEPQLVAMSCLHLALKLNKSKVPLADFEALNNDCFDGTLTVADIRTCGLLVERALNFELSPRLPHKFLIFFLSETSKLLADNETLAVLARTGFSLLNDSFYDRKILEFDCVRVAAAILHLSCDIHGVPYRKQIREMILKFVPDFNDSICSNISDFVLDIYNQEG